MKTTTCIATLILVLVLACNNVTACDANCYDTVTNSGIEMQVPPPDDGGCVLNELTVSNIEPINSDTVTAEGLPFYNSIIVSGVNIAITSPDGNLANSAPSLFFANLPAKHDVTVIVNSERDIPHQCVVWIVYPDGSNSNAKAVPPEPGYHLKTGPAGVYAFACYTAPGEADLIGQIVYDGIIVP